MVFTIHSSASFLGDGGWPKLWPPVQLPPPSPLAAASSLLWSPTLTSTAPAVAVAASLYSTQLRPGAASGSGDTQGSFQMAFLDQRIALMRFDASHTPENVAA